MEFITQGNRIAVENFDKGKLYTVLWKNDTQENLMCISIGADCVVFQGEAPINLFTLSMRNADTIDSIEPTQLGTTNYNNLINKPQINGVDLIGNKTDEQLGLVSQSDLEDYATNASVVAGLATKQDALSSSQLSAANSGITSELVTQIGTNENNISKDDAALVELVDDGAKNLINQANDSFTAANKDYQISLLAGDYIVYFGSLSSTDTDATTCQAAFRDESSAVSNVVQISRGSDVYGEFSLSAPCTKLRLYSSDSTSHGSGDTCTFTNIMICTKSVWDISHTYQPYAMSNAEITAWILAHS